MTLFRSFHVEIAVILTVTGLWRLAFCIHPSVFLKNAWMNAKNAGYFNEFSMVSAWGGSVRGQDTPPKHPPGIPKYTQAPPRPHTTPPHHTPTPPNTQLTPHILIALDFKRF